ncbi:MAG: YggS family pyridoxal phosphate-dependent enzyme [Flavisolibacter sp.]|jgi:pyridoxal phosphate enzyme (YggS family)|nr:YggS family pyridoxal phosphate-dependent enzyme [Flavisolibacter sp.]
MSSQNQFIQIRSALDADAVRLVAVSKVQPVKAIIQLYELGQRDFGENYVQELVDKFQQLPKDIRWHFIGHLQTNKVKFIAPFIHLIQGVDSLKLLKEINKQAARSQRVISVLLQVHIAEEETKFGFNEDELHEIINYVHVEKPGNVDIKGLMGMGSFSSDNEKIRQEFKKLKGLWDQYFSKENEHILSMGMSSDYNIAIEEGSNMVRIGSLLFGSRNAFK